MRVKVYLCTIECAENLKMDKIPPGALMKEFDLISVPLVGHVLDLEINPTILDATVVRVCEHLEKDDTFSIVAKPSSNFTYDYLLEKRKDRGWELKADQEER